MYGRVDEVLRDMEKLVAVQGGEKTGFKAE